MTDQPSVGRGMGAASPARPRPARSWPRPDGDPDPALAGLSRLGELGCPSLSESRDRPRITAVEKSLWVRPASVQIGADRLTAERPSHERHLGGDAYRPRQGRQQRTRFAPRPRRARAGRERARHPERNGSRTFRRPGRNQPNEKKNTPVHEAPPCIPRRRDQERSTEKFVAGQLQASATGPRPGGKHVSSSPRP